MRTCCTPPSRATPFPGPATPYRNDFVGELPPELGQLTDLVYLELTFNELTGSISLELPNLTAMEDLWFDYNAGFCAPPELLGWLEQVGYASGPICAG